MSELTVSEKTKLNNKIRFTHVLTSGGGTTQNGVIVDATP